MAQIVSADNLYEYSIALRNSGITVSNLQMLERQILTFILVRRELWLLCVK